MSDAINHFTLESTPNAHTDESGNLILDAPITVLNAAIGPAVREYQDFSTPNPDLYYRLKGFTDNDVEFAYNVVQFTLKKNIYVSNSGDDATGARGSISKPFETILAAAQVFQPGDTIVIAAGTFYITTSIPAMVNGTVKGAGIGQTVIINQVVLTPNFVTKGKSGFTCGTGQKFSDFTGLNAYRAGTDTSKRMQSFLGNGWEDTTGPAILGVEVDGVRCEGWSDCFQFSGTSVGHSLKVSNSTLISYWDYLAMNGGGPHTLTLSNVAGRAVDMALDNFGSLVGGCNTGNGATTFVATGSSFYSNRPYGWGVAYGTDAQLTFDSCTFDVAPANKVIVLSPGVGVGTAKVTFINCNVPDSGITGNPVVVRS